MATQAKRVVGVRMKGRARAKGAEGLCYLTKDGQPRDPRWPPSSDGNGTVPTPEGDALRGEGTATNGSLAIHRIQIPVPGGTCKAMNNLCTIAQRAVRPNELRGLSFETAPAFLPARTEGRRRSRWRRKSLPPYPHSLVAHEAPLDPILFHARFSDGRRHFGPRIP